MNRQEEIEDLQDYLRKLTADGTLLGKNTLRNIVISLKRGTRILSCMDDAYSALLRVLAEHDVVEVFEHTDTDYGYREGWSPLFGRGDRTHGCGNMKLRLRPDYELPTFQDALLVL